MRHADDAAPAAGSPERTGPGTAAPPAQAPVRRGPGRFVRALVALVALVGMVAFAVVLARLTLEASPASVPLTHDNLTPGRSIEAYLGRPAFVDTVKQLGGNILLGVPFGILLPLLSRRARGFLRVALLTAVTMLFVELVQGALVTGRAFDVDDVLLNTTGALLGYVLVGRRLGRAVHPRTRPRRWRRRRPADTSA
ncbi:VanZ family protein [Streptomyces griseus]|uniref:VanZ family protein n=1 Tax=Streptomyces griseus TaxID=1911 RepID=UPI0004C5E835|nr:VanZ family protein [Streptomyces griseus]